MARNRMIKPEFWSSGTLSKISLESRLLFIGLWNFSDDFGVVLDSNRKILGEIFPLNEEISERKLENWKGELIDTGVLVKATHKGINYLIIRSWGEHQKVEHPSTRRWLTSEIQEKLLNDSSEPHEPFTTTSRSKVKVERESGKVKEKEKVENTVTRDTAATGEELGKQEWILRLKEEEKLIFLSSIHQLIKDENVTRPKNPFNWQPRTGTTTEKDWLALIYQSWNDEEKIKILTEALNPLHGKMNWSNYVALGIKYMIRATRKTPIRSHYGFVRDILKHPIKLASESFDGTLRG